MMEHIKSFSRIDDRFSGMNSREKSSEEQMYKRYEINNLWEQKGRKKFRQKNLKKAFVSCGEILESRYGREVAKYKDVVLIRKLKADSVENI